MLKKQLSAFSKVNKKKVFLTAMTVVIATSLFSMTVFAVGASDVTTLISGLLDILQIVIIAIGAGLAVMGIVNLLEGYGNDNAGAKSQGTKQVMAGAGVALVGLLGIPLLDTFVTSAFGG